MMRMHGARRAALVVMAGVLPLSAIVAGCSKSVSRDDAVKKVVAEGAGAFDQKFAECYVDGMTAAGIALDKVTFDEKTMKDNGYTDAQGEMAETLGKACLLPGSTPTTKK